MSEFDPGEIVRVLQTHEVQFVIIGGIAAAIHGAGWATQDLDIVVQGDGANLG